MIGQMWGNGGSIQSGPQSTWYKTDLKCYDHVIFGTFLTPQNINYAGLNAVGGGAAYFNIP